MPVSSCGIRCAPCFCAVAAAAALIDKASVHVRLPYSSLCSPGGVSYSTSSKDTATLYTVTGHLWADFLIILHRCNRLNPATLLPLPDGEPCCITHDCLAAVEMVSKAREVLSDTPLGNPAWLLFCDGSRQWSFLGNITAYAAVSPRGTPAAHSDATGKSALAAELIALTRACTLAEGKTAAIYTDSRCAVGVCLAVGTICRSRGLLTSAGNLIANDHTAAALLQDSHLPSKTAVVHVQRIPRKCCIFRKWSGWQELLKSSSKWTPLFLLYRIFKLTFILDWFYQLLSKCPAVWKRQMGAKGC